MAFPLTKNEADSYFEALKLLKSPYINEKEELRSYNDLIILVKNFNVCNNFLQPKNIKIDFLLGNKAKNILENIFKKIKQRMEVDTNKSSKTKKNKCKKITHETKKIIQQLQRCKAVIHLQLGRILWRTEHFKEGEKELSKCWLIVEKNDKDNVTMQVKQAVLNECGLLSFKQGNLEKSLKYFEEAIKVVEKQKEYCYAWCVDDFFRAEAYDSQFKVDQKQKFVLFRNCVETLYYLTLINLKLNKNNDASILFYTILSLMLHINSYNALEWSNLAIELSLYFSYIQQSKASRQCLAAAETVLKRMGDCPSNLFVQLSEGLSKEEKKEKVSKMWAKLYLHWAKYCTMLLSIDQFILNNSIELILPIDVTECESQINASKLASFKDAKDVFLQGQAWLKRSKEFYNLQSFSSKYVDLEILNGDLFYYLSQHEPDKSRKCKMLKRKIDILTKLLSQLNKNEYSSFHIKLFFHLAETYFRLASQKYCILLTLDTIKSPMAVDKMISLARKSINFSKSFISYHKGLENQHLENLNLQHLFINSHFNLASSFYMISNMTHNNSFEIKESEKNFKYVVEYFRNNPPTIPVLIHIHKKSKECLEEFSKTHP